MVKNDDLSVLKGSKRVRDKISVMFGSNDKAGVSHGLFEIIANSVDRHKKGFGNKIIVTSHKDGVLEVEDYGDGLPMLWNEKEQAYNWDIALKTLYGGSNYEQSNDNNGVLGTNGLGLTTAQYSSEFMEVISYREDGKKVEVKFKQGRPVDFITGELLVEDTNDFLTQEDGLKAMKITENKDVRTGTIIKYRPDSEVFIETNIDSDWIKNKLLKQAVVNCGLELVFNDEVAQEEITYKYNSIEDYLRDFMDSPLSEVIKCKKDSIGRDSSKNNSNASVEYKASYEINLFFDNISNKQEYFHNGSELTELNKNATTLGFKKAIVNAVHKAIIDNKLYKKNEKKIKFEDIEPSLVALINTKSNLTSYSNQTKLSISNSFIEEFIEKDFEEQLSFIFIEKKELSKNICNRVLINSRARESAENTRLNIKKKLESDNSTFSKPEGLINCKSKNPLERELFICEGKSALGSLIKARNSQYQACIPVRGKILNLLKNKGDLKKILSSEIVVNIMKALGCGIVVDSKIKELSTFDINNLKYCKIIISSDADVDGYQIRTLILAMIYVLCPDLIAKGYVYIVEAPLFEATIKGTKKIHYLYTEEDKNEFLNKHKTKNIELNRNKGLGEMTPEAMSETMMNPETRRLIQISMEDAKKADEIFELFLGEAIEPRKEYIMQNFDKYSVL